MDLLKFFYEVLWLVIIVLSAYLFAKGILVATGVDLSAVESGSMEPAFHRGDLLCLTNPSEEPIRVGEVVVFKIKGEDTTIVHRVIIVHENGNGAVKFLTKGDNNRFDDSRYLYEWTGQNWLTPKDVVGRVKGSLPYVGMPKIVISEYPVLKYSLCLAFLVLYVQGI